MSTQLSRFEDEFEPNPVDFRDREKDDRHSRRSRAGSQTARVRTSEPTVVASEPRQSFLSRLVDRLLSWLSGLFNWWVIVTSWSGVRSVVRRRSTRRSTFRRHLVKGAPVPRWHARRKHLPRRGSRAQRGRAVVPRRSRIMNTYRRRAASRPIPPPLIS